MSGLTAYKRSSFLQHLGLASLNVGYGGYAQAYFVPDGAHFATAPGISFMRPSKRAADEMRKVSFERGVARYAEGSCLVRFGDTHVLCAASLEDKPPPWLRGQGRGWVTAEYSMLPRATATRTPREVTKGRPTGRTLEIAEFAESDCDPHGLAWHNGVLYSCDAGIHPGWPENKSATHGYIFRIDLL